MWRLGRSEEAPQNSNVDSWSHSLNCLLAVRGNDGNNSTTVTALGSDGNNSTVTTAVRPS